MELGEAPALGEALGLYGKTWHQVMLTDGDSEFYVAKREASPVWVTIRG